MQTVSFVKSVLFLYLKLNTSKDILHHLPLPGRLPKECASIIGGSAMMGRT